MAAVPATAVPALATLLTDSGGGGGGGSVKRAEGIVVEGTETAAVLRLDSRSYGGSPGGEEREGMLDVGNSAAAAAAAAAAVAAAATTGEEAAVAAAVAAAVTVAREGGEGIRLHAYQLISSEPRLLLLRAEPELAERLRFLLDTIPGLRRGYWNARLRKAAPLLAIDTATLKGRLDGLAEIFPASADVQVRVGFEIESQRDGEGGGVGEMCVYVIGWVRGWHLLCSA